MSRGLSEAQKEAAEELVQEQVEVIEETIQEYKSEQLRSKISELTEEVLSELDDRGVDIHQAEVDVVGIARANVAQTMFGSGTSAETANIAVGGRHNHGRTAEVSLDTDTQGPKMITEEVEVPVAGQEDGKYAGTVEVEKVDPRSVRSNMEFQEEFEKEYSVPRANRGQQERSSDPEDVPAAGRRNNEYDYVDKTSLPDPAMDDESDQDGDDTDGGLPWYQ